MTTITEHSWAAIIRKEHARQAREDAARNQRLLDVVHKIEAHEALAKAARVAPERGRD